MKWMIYWIIVFWLLTFTSLLGNEDVAQGPGSWSWFPSLASILSNFNIYMEPCLIPHSFFPSSPHFQVYPPPPSHPPFPRHTLTHAIPRDCNNFKCLTHISPLSGYLPPNLPDHSLHYSQHITLQLIWNVQFTDPLTRSPESPPVLSLQLRFQDPTFQLFLYCYCCCCITSVVSDSVQPHRRQPTRLRRPWDSPVKNTGVGCHFLLQCIKWKVKGKSFSRLRPLATPWTAAYQPCSSVHGIFQPRVLEWVAIGTTVLQLYCFDKHNPGQFQLSTDTRNAESSWSGSLGHMSSLIFIKSHGHLTQPQYFLAFLNWMVGWII